MDYDVVIKNANIHTMVNNPNPVRKLSISKALKTLTINSAFLAHEEKERGSIEVGKYADLTVIE